MTRKRPTKDEMLAAALIQIGGIEYEHAKLMTPAQVISLFQCDHYPIRVESGGTNHPSNLQWLYRGAHKTKTAKADIPEIHKGQRLRDNLAAFNARMAAKAGEFNYAEERIRKVKRKNRIPWGRR